ncbi:MSHA biogenesis protein MshP [Aquabacterium sp.]|uniref:MSHA biogenesis protein MshP n=1 Tax=Aquabacterium sp. TaxID=1872578 RepID=UPI0025BCD545|nr:MSHA biogenesis protein MshP [Aquabacterium sp.]
MTMPSSLHPMPIGLRTQRGLGMIAAIVVLVMMAVLAAAVTRLTWTQQVSSAQDVMGARAFQAANAGTEWGMYQALKGSWMGSNCAGSQTLDLTSSMGFKVTVSCTTQSTAYNEGQDASGTNLTTRLYVIDAVACNGSAASCPDNANSAGMNYVERKRQAIISSADPGF